MPMGGGGAGASRGIVYGVADRGRVRSAGSRPVTPFQAGSVFLSPGGLYFSVSIAATMLCPLPRGASAEARGEQTDVGHWSHKWDLIRRSLSGPSPSPVAAIAERCLKRNGRSVALKFDRHGGRVGDCCDDAACRVVHWPIPVSTILPEQFDHRVRQRYEGRRSEGLC